MQRKVVSTSQTGSCISGFAMEQQTLVFNQSICDAIQQLKVDMFSHIDAKMDNIQSGLQAIQGSLSILNDHVSELEQRVSSNEDNITELQNQVKSLVSERAYLRDKIDDAENRSRAHNLRFLRVPEKSEGQDILGFMRGLNQLLLGEENCMTPPVIERAHRSLTTLQSNESNAGLRPILVKLLSLQERQRILRLSREKKELRYKGIRIYIFPDYSPGVIHKRRQYDGIKKKLREKKMEYSLLYPATLRITAAGKAVLFKSPGEAEFFLQELETHSPD